MWVVDFCRSSFENDSLQQLELEELKKLAKDNITNKLTATNVLPELFSEFASL